MNPHEEELRQKLLAFKPQFYQQFPQPQFMAGLGLGFNADNTGVAIHLELNRELPQSVIDAMVQSIPFGPVVVTDQSQRHVVALAAKAPPAAPGSEPS